MCSKKNALGGENNNNNIAILLIEFQKTWTKKGIFSWLIRKEYESRNVLSNTINLVEKSRKKWIKVIQAPLILDKKDKNYKKTPFPARLLNCFTKWTWKAEFTEGVYEKTDIIIKGRYAFDACKWSNLEESLIQNEIKKIFICGFTTSHCVKETMDSLIQKWFDCVLVSDCTADMSNKLQNKIEKKFEWKIIESKNI